jgi:hypothetical protein
MRSPWRPYRRGATSDASAVLDAVLDAVLARLSAVVGAILDRRRLKIRPDRADETSGRTRITVA